MRMIWTILKYIFGAIALWMVIAVGVVAYDIISVRRDINHSSESFGIGDSIYEFWVPEGKLIWINFSSSRNSAFCLKATFSRNELTVELPGKQNKLQTLENHQDLPSTLQMYSDAIRECDTIGMTVIGPLAPYGGSFSVYYSDEKVTDSKEPIFSGS